MRVLILRHGYYPRDPRVRREVGALVSRGHEVDIICLREPDQTRRETVAGARVWRVPLGHHRAGMGRYVAEYGAFLLAAAVLATLRHLVRRYQVVQVNTLPDALVFAALGPRLLGARVLLDLHELSPELFASKFGVTTGHWLPRLLGRIEQAAIRFADACLAVSEPCLARYVARGAPAARFTVVMNTPDPDLFGRRAPGGRAPGPARIVSHGTLVERYGYDLLVQAMTGLPGARLEILGDGELLPALRREVARLGLDDRVALPGFVPLDAIPDRLAGAAVGVVANRADPFTELVVPTKLLEYVGLGIPAVVARTAAVRACFDDSMVRFFTPGDAGDLTAALRAVLADPVGATAMARRAQAAFEARYGWTATAERYVRAVEGLVGR